MISKVCKSLLPAFFNAGIGRLLSDLTSETLNSLLNFEHLSESGNRVLHRVIENAKEYYAATACRRQEIDRIVYNNAICED